MHLFHLLCQFTSKNYNFKLYALHNINFSLFEIHINILKCMYMYTKSLATSGFVFPANKVCGPKKQYESLNANSGIHKKNHIPAYPKQESGK